MPQEKLAALNTDCLKLDFADGWLTVWFNTPANRNALSQELRDELHAVLNTVRDDRSVRGITLRGAGGIFCAGADLKSFREQSEATHEQAAAVSADMGRLFAALQAQPQVVVALIEGAAIAGGLGLACSVDVVITTAGAKYSLTETMLGIPPAQIAPYVVQRIGVVQARRLMVTGARFLGDEAGRLGLADVVVEQASDLEEAEQQIRRGVLKCAPGANATTKQLLLELIGQENGPDRERAATLFADCLLDEGREGMASFFEKRKPNWQV